MQGIGPSYASKILRFGLRVGDLVDWNTFLEKYNKFIEAAKFQFHVPDFDTTNELDQLKQLRERMIKDGMIVDSIDFMNKAVKDPK